MAIEDDEVDAAMCELAERGIEVGQCGAAPLAALRQLFRTGELGALIGSSPTMIALLATEGPTAPDRWRNRCV